MKTISDKRCLSRWEVVLQKMEAIYNRAFPKVHPGDDFWDLAEKLASYWDEMTAKRPIGDADLDKAEKLWLKKFIDLCVVERNRVQQA